MSKFNDLMNFFEKEYGLFGIDSVMLEKAMTSKSYTKERFDKGEIASPDGFDYQELELIGDKVIGLVVAEHLMLLGTKTEGNLTSEISAIVDNENLKRISNDLGLHMFVNVGNNQNIVNTKVEADIFEALVGALYLSVGFLSTKKFLVKIFFGGDTPKLEFKLEDEMYQETIVRDKGFIQSSINRSVSSTKIIEPRLDLVKNNLQEICQRYKLSNPYYEVVGITGPDHQRVFKVDVSINGEHLGSGEGTPKKHAEKLAAKEALQIMQERVKSGKIFDSYLAQIMSKYQ